MTRSAKTKADVRELAARIAKIATGTRMRCKDRVRTYQMGAQYGRDQFWMLCETPAQRGLVTATVIDEHFELIPVEVC